MIDHDGLSAWRLDHAWMHDRVPMTMQKVQAALDALRVVRKIELVQALLTNGWVDTCVNDIIETSVSPTI